MPNGFLDQLGTRYRTDKASFGHGFLNLYERFLDPIRAEVRSVLEIGVCDGASLPMWRDFFPNANVVGLDINPDTLKHAGERITVEIRDQSNVADLVEVARTYGPFDLVVDDGSHQWDHQITSLRSLLPHVKPGRYYILEDLDTSYGTHVSIFRGIAAESAASYLHRFSDYMIGDSVIDISAEPDAFIRSYARRCEFVVLSKRTSIIKLRE
jgi:cephalosporin hydroxylase